LIMSRPPMVSVVAQTSLSIVRHPTTSPV